MLFNHASYLLPCWRTPSVLRVLGCVDPHSPLRAELTCIAIICSSKLEAHEVGWENEVD